ncbi:MAG TPA: hypothetical protein VGI88_07225, partial [Verrucomicrobiae bacterium]
PALLLKNAGYVYLKKARERRCAKKSAGGLAQSKTLARVNGPQIFRQVLDCGGPPPLFFHGNWKVPEPAG